MYKSFFFDSLLDNLAVFSYGTLGLILEKRFPNHLPL